MFIERLRRLPGELDAAIFILLAQILKSLGLFGTQSQYYYKRGTRVLLASVPALPSWVHIEKLSLKRRLICLSAFAATLVMCLFGKYHASILRPNGSS